jgi:hypothetical protein
MISHETIKEVRNRSRGRCENPLCKNTNKHKYFEHHHIYWKSQYEKQDRDEAWNLAYICRECHFEIHNGTDRRIDTYLKRSADIRKPKNLRVHEVSKDILRARIARKNSYKRNIERYKKNNSGLSPLQVAYRRWKTYRDSVKK